MTEIRLDCVFPHSPALVWRALTDPALLREWAMENDFEAVAGACFLLRPSGLAGLDGPIDVEMIDVDPRHRLTMLWQDGALHSRVVWRLEPVGSGTALTVTQTGFLGPNGSDRRRALLATYTTMFEEDLAATLDRLALADAADGGVPRQRTPMQVYSAAGLNAGPVRTEAPPRATPIDPAPDRPDDAPRQGTRLMVGVGVLVFLILAAVAIGAWAARPDGGDDAGGPVRNHREPGVAMQPGGQGGSELAGSAGGPSGNGSGQPSANGSQPSGTATASPLASGAAGVLTATWQPVEQGPLQWQVKVTVTNPGPKVIKGWTVVMQYSGLGLLVTEPVGAKLASNLGVHTFTPVDATLSVPARGSVSFTVKVTPAPSGVTTCTIDGRPCS